MGWQVIAVLALVAVAGLYLVVSAYRALRGKSGSCGGCGCGKKPTPASEPQPATTLVPVEQVQLRRRAGDS